MNIHALFILTKAGACLYSRHFTEEFREINENLITPFFSAIYSFSQNTISRKLEELEMSGLRFLFRVEEDFIFVLLSDAKVSILFAKTRLDRIIDIFFRVYEHLGALKEITAIENEKFDTLIDFIIIGKEEIFKKKAFYKRVVDVFKDYLFNNEIIGAALLSTKGNIIYSSLPNEILINSLRELEIRFQAGAMNLPELYYGLENNQKVFSKIISHDKKKINFLTVLLFERKVPLGMAHITLQKLTKEIRELF